MVDLRNVRYYAEILPVNMDARLVELKVPGPWLLHYDGDSVLVMNRWFFARMRTVCLLYHFGGAYVAGCGVGLVNAGEELGMKLGVSFN